MANDPLDSLFQTPAVPATPAPTPAEGDPLDSVFTKAAVAPAAAPVSAAAPAQSSQVDPLDAMFAAGTPKPAVAAPTATADPLDAVFSGNQGYKYGSETATRGLTEDERKYGSKSPEQMEDEPWYSKAWEWVNSPLYDLHKWGTREGAGNFERGLETGLEDIGSGFTSPLMIGLTLATFGGSAVEEAGVGALRAIGVSKLAAPVVANTAKLLMSAGFTTQMIGGLITQSPQFLDAMKDGDVEEATRLGTNLVAGLAFVREGIKHGIEDVGAVKESVREFQGKPKTSTANMALANEIAGLHDEAVQRGDDAARAKMEEIQRMLKEGGNDPIREAGIRHYMTQDGDVERIMKMKGIAEGTLKPRALTPEEQKFEDQGAELRDWSSQTIDRLKNPDGTPRTFFLADSLEGTHKLGQTLAQTGDVEDAHLIKLSKPKEYFNEDNLRRDIADAGGQEALREKLLDQGFDGLTYGKGAGQKMITFDNDQYRKVADIKEATKSAWNPEHVYIAVDKKYLDQIQNAGIKSAQQKSATYFDTPETALKNAVKPDSGNMKDLVVMSVPRSEVEYGIHEDAAKNAPREEAPKYVYHIRKVGEQGVPEGTNHVTQSLEKAEAALKSREQGGKPAATVESSLNESKGPLEREINISLKDEKGNEIGTARADISPDKKFVNMNSSGIESTKGSSAYRDQGYGLEMYLEAMRKAKEQGAKFFASDEAGSTTPDADRVWKSLGKRFETRINEDSATNHQARYRIDLSKVSAEDLAKPARQPKFEIVGVDTNKLNAKDFRLNKSVTGEHPFGSLIKPVPESGVTKLADIKPAGPQPLGAAPRIEGELTTTRSHMPSHLMEMDTSTPTGEVPKVTGRATPLRPFGAEDLPGDNSRFQAQLTPKQKTDYLSGMDYAINRMTDTDKEIAQTLRGLYDNSFNKAYEKGLIRQWVESYHPQAWSDQTSSMWQRVFNRDSAPVNNVALNELRHDTNSGNFDTNINAAKHRAYNTEFQGVMAGQVFKSDDLAMHVYNHMRAVDRAIAGREYIDNLRSKDTRAQDGRPAAVLAGSTRRIGGKENPAIAISPDSVKAIHISPEKAAAMQEGIDPRTNMSPLEAGLKNGTIEKLPWTVLNEDGEKVPAYAYSSDGYISIDSPHMRGWGFSGVDTDGNPAILHGQIKIHPDFADHVRQVIGAEDSPVRNSPALKAISAASGEAKGLLLSLSPFHVIQEALRAAMIGIAPWEFSHIDINDPKYAESLGRGVRNGLIRNNYKAEDKFSTGYASHSKLISAVPGLNRFQNWMQSFLFEKYIPGLKDRAYLKVFDDLRDSNPHLTADEAASRAADVVNDTFGGQNWRKLGVNAAQQDFMRMFALAPDWLVSELNMTRRAIGLGDKESGAYARKQMAKQMAGIWLGARVINMLVSGQMHNEAPFGVVHKKENGEETVYSVRTLPTDILHVLSDPEQFIRGRVNPLVVKPTIEALTGRDEMGRRAPLHTQITDTVRGIVPIVGQGIIKGSPLSGPEQLARGLGGSVYKYRTEAEKLAQQYASDRMPSGPVNQEELAQHQKEIRLEDQFRKGEISRADLNAQLPKRRVTDVIRRQDMNALQARFDRLPMSEAINVWDAATKTEKDLLHAQLWKKRQAWLKQHKPAERENEPVWRKMQAAFGDLR